MLPANKDNDNIIGTYESTTNWPTIEINQKDDHYIFKWGVLEGKIYSTEDEGYMSNLGVLSRDFKIENDTLISGSLAYKRVNP